MERLNRWSSLVIFSESLLLQMRTPEGYCLKDRDTFREKHVYPKEEGKVCYEKMSLWQTPAPCDRLGVCVSVAPASHPRCKKQRIISGKTECGYDFGPRPETLRNGSVFSRSLRWSLRYSGSQGIVQVPRSPPPPPQWDPAVPGKWLCSAAP